MVLDIISWHFYEKPKELINELKLWLKALGNYFSLGILLSTLFAPWHRDLSIYVKGMGLGEYFIALTNNIISRIIGAIVRLFVLIAGSIVQILVFAFGIMAVICWLLLPFIIIFLIGAGIALL